MRKKIVAALVIFLLILALVGLSKQIKNALESAKRLDNSSDQLSSLQQENRDLKIRLSEVSQPDFVEEQARNKLNLGREGEAIIIIPEGEINKILKQDPESKIVTLPNWQAWLKLILY